MSITSSSFFNTEYNNFDARTPEALSELWEAGLVISSSSMEEYVKQLIPADVYIDTIYYFDLFQGMEKHEVQALAGFNKLEPNYGDYRNSWEAKEARASYTPELEYIYLFDKEIFEKNLAPIVEKKRAENKTHNEARKIYLESEIAKYEGYLTTVTARIIIEPINGRKYKFQVLDKKFETQAIAEAFVRQSKQEMFDYYGSSINRLKAELAQLD
jgi:hypothetical protein